MDDSLYSDFISFNDETKNTNSILEAVSNESNYSTAISNLNNDKILLLIIDNEIALSFKPFTNTDNAVENNVRVNKPVAADGESFMHLIPTSSQGIYYENQTHSGSWTTNSEHLFIDSGFEDLNEALFRLQTISPTSVEQLTYGPEQISTATTCPSSTPVSGKLHQCLFCHDIFPEFCQKISHIEQVHSLHCCSSCEKIFPTSKQLRAHHIVHSDKREFSCTICHTKFKRKHDLKYHTKNSVCNTKFVDTIFSCHTCNFVTKSKKFLQSHVLIHLGFQSYLCEKCGIQCQHQRQYMQHKNTHIAQKEVICDICFRSFSFEHNLKNHIRTQHEDRFLYQCEVCGRGYTHKTSLEYHLKAHKFENQVSCEICHRLFSNKKSLTNHKKIHNGQKEFVCKTCGKAYFNNSSLQEHLLNHTGRMPFKCKYCKKSFTTRKKVLTHERTHNTNRVIYKCNHCTCSYFSKTKLNCHVVKKHSPKNE